MKTVPNNCGRVIYTSVSVRISLACNSKENVADVGGTEGFIEGVWESHSRRRLCRLEPGYVNITVWDFATMQAILQAV